MLTIFIVEFTGELVNGASARKDESDPRANKKHAQGDDKGLDFHPADQESVDVSEHDGDAEPHEHAHGDAEVENPLGHHNARKAEQGALAQIDSRNQEHHALSRHDEKQERCIAHLIRQVMNLDEIIHVAQKLKNGEPQHHQDKPHQEAVLLQR